VWPGACGRLHDTAAAAAGALLDATADDDPELGFESLLHAARQTANTARIAVPRATRTARKLRPRRDHGFSHAPLQSALQAACVVAPIGSLSSAETTRNASEKRGRRRGHNDDRLPIVPCSTRHQGQWDP